ncbi:GNAT family N-acetyltransferase [Metabacillus indicus]|uniref:GNAT family N-acetyltransferase n=1 Tax=Metabacillus indicus TaxID=246786 RepID=UPI002A02C0A4|nr:GNAT family N-acetyltransferase [Metabacillus indicus]MDX8291354.1 GNAT family N-acetyltransferase [Metabacillus indicus]
MKIRLFEEKDLEEVINLYIDTVCEINGRDYSCDHIHALAPKRLDHYENWGDLLTVNTTLLAVKNKKITGFGTLTHNGDIHFLYSHKDHQSTGTGSAILQALEKTARDAGHKKVTVSTGITARPFFMNRGYSVLTEHYVSIDPMLFIQYKMKKYL